MASVYRLTSYRLVARRLAASCVAYNLQAKQLGPGGPQPTRARASSDWTPTMHDQTTSSKAVLDSGKGTVDLPTGPRYMEGFGSLDWDPEFAAFVVWREARRQREGGAR